MNTEYGTFISLVFSVSGIFGKKWSMFDKHMAQKISVKQVKDMRK